MITVTRVNTISVKQKNTPINEFVNIMSWHPKDTKYYELSPYYLKTDGNEENESPPGVIFENYYQGSKIYEYVYDIEVYPHHSFKGNPKYLRWKYICSNNLGNEIHYDSLTDTIQAEYYIWKNSLNNCLHAIRYPNKKTNAKKCQFSMGTINGVQHRYNYLNARKEIYVKEYCRLIRQLPIYYHLLQLLRKGVNITIAEMDVPYKGKKGYYGTLLDINGNYIPDLNNINLLLNDASEAFGHGLCLCKALLEDL